MAQALHPWQDLQLGPDERARLVLAEMTEDEKFSWLSSPIALPIPGHPPLPEEVLGSAAYFPGVPGSASRPSSRPTRASG